jgi:hypothetical protein
VPADDGDGYDDGATVILGLGGRAAADVAEIGDYAESPVARVLRTETDGTRSGCTDAHARNNPFLLKVARLRGGRLRVGLVVAGQLAGRCAGPRIDGELAGLPTRTIRMPRVGRSTVAKLVGRVPYSSGRFSGAVASRLRVRIERAPGPSFPFLRREAPTRRKSLRVVHLSALYRISGFSGASSAAFEGLPEPGCSALDACGVSGSARWAIDGGVGELQFEGDAPARRSDRGLPGAIAALERDDGASVLAFAVPRRGTTGTTSADVRRPDGVTCRDSQPAEAPVLYGGVSRGRFRLAFEPDDETSSVELLRTGCPGPLRHDVLGDRAAAVGGVPVRWLGSRKQFEMRVAAGGSFTGIGYRGTHETAFTFTLERVSAKVTYRTESTR